MIEAVYAVFPDRAEAERVARDMVERRLAACVNILGGCTSFYRWNGAVERAEEVPVLFKTAAEQAATLMAAIGQAHSHDVPAVMRWSEEAAPAYADWVVESVSP